MLKLNFPTYSFRIKNKENKRLIFDPIRKKFIILSPEEWVRQHVIQFLIETKGYSPNLINVEKQLRLNNTTKRYDVVVFKSDGTVNIIVECKAPQVDITQDSFYQIARYNMVVNANVLMLSNGLSHFYCQMDSQKACYKFLPDLPHNLRL